eukprot:2579883-Amphidinium_carterae.1
MENLGGVVTTPRQEELSKRAGEILLYDVGFCIYAIVFVVAFFFNCYAVSASIVCENAAGTLAAVLSIIFAFLAFQFMILWFCCLHCCYGVVGKVVNVRTVHLGPKGQAAQATGPTIVGVPVGAPGGAFGGGAAPAPAPSGGASGSAQNSSQASSLAQVGISVAGQFAGRLLQGGQQKRELLWSTSAHAFEGTAT